MPDGLERREDRGDFRFVPFSCAGRKAYLRSAFGLDLFERSLEVMRVGYEFYVAGYVVMPEHVHLLASVRLGVALQALKLQWRGSPSRAFWSAKVIASIPTGGVLDTE